MTLPTNCLVCGAEIALDMLVIMNHMMEHDQAEMMAFLITHVSRTAELLDVRDPADLNLPEMMATLLEEMREKKDQNG